MTDDAERFVAPLDVRGADARPVTRRSGMSRNAFRTFAWCAKPTSLAIVPGDRERDREARARHRRRSADDRRARRDAFRILIAPAMNDAMYEHPATRENLATLRARGVRDRRSRARLSRRTRDRHRAPGRRRSEFSTRSNALLARRERAARRARRDHRGADARGVRSGALLAQRVDRRDRRSSSRAKRRCAAPR